MSQTLREQQQLHDLAQRGPQRSPWDEDGYNSGNALCAAVGYTLLGVLIAWLVVAWV